MPVPGIGPTPAAPVPPDERRRARHDQIAVFVVAAIAAIVLWFVIRHTRAGLEMRAVVDREQLAGLRGVNAARTSALAWVMTMVLAGLGGVLIAPLFQLQDTIITFVVLGSLAAVVLGGLRSIPIAFAGGLLLGVMQNLVAGYSDDFLPSWLEPAQRAEVGGAVHPRDPLPVGVRARPLAPRGLGGRRETTARPSRGPPGVAAAAAVGDLHHRAGRLLVGLVPVRPLNVFGLSFSPRPTPTTRR